ncbi:MAG TPA: hypothetical protein VFS96_02945, partial [Nitrolancea sp.]|nr:hypothetical protein [Nitrolancea sp.]
MIAVSADDWQVMNQRYLMTALSRIREALEHHATHDRADGIGNVPAESPYEGPDNVSDTGAAPALHALGAIFGLTPFERDLLLLCAGIELDARFSSLCAEAQGNPDRPYPTFSLALAALDDPHWSALSPVAPLRHWRLIEIVGAPATPITVSPLKIDERILHYLAGVQHLDERLTGVIDAVSPDDDLVPSHRTAAERIESAWREASKAGHPLPMIQLCGGDAESKRSVAANACAAAGLHLFLLPADLIQLDGGEREGFQRLWTREAALMSGALYVETEGLDRNDSRLVAATTRLLEHTGGAVFLGTSDRWQGLRRGTVTIDIAKPTRREQRDLWRSLLGDAAV